MTTPIEEAHRVIHLAEAADLLPTAQRAAAILLNRPVMLAALKALMEYHLGYSSEHRSISALVSRLLDATLKASNGELKWATELPLGKAPEFRRALNELQAHFHRNPV